VKAFSEKVVGIRTSLVLLIIGYIAVALYLSVVLNFEFLRSDVESYWEDSLDWQRPFDRFHVPGYPLTIALVRGISFGAIPPVLLMMGINLLALLIGALAVYKIVIISGIRNEFAFLGACLYGFWPLVGFVYTVHPLAEVPAMSLLLTGLWALLQSRLRIAALLLGLSLIVHKGMWPFVGLIVLASLYQSKRRISKDLQALAILVLPISVLWLLGTLHYGSPTWIISTSIGVGVETRSTLPILEGVIGTLGQGGVKALVKGGWIVVLALITMALLLLSFRNKPSYFQYAIALSFGCLFLFLFLTHLEIWAAVRFSRLLVLPLIWNLGSIYQRESAIRLKASVVVVALLVLFLTQFIYAWYMACVFFK